MAAGWRASGRARAAAAGLQQARTSGQDTPAASLPLHSLRSRPTHIHSPPTSPQIHAGNVEVCVVGDFEPAELEAAVLRYLGTVGTQPKVGGAGAAVAGGTPTWASG